MSIFSLCFQLSYDDSSRLLSLNLQAEFDAPPLTRELIDTALKASKFDDFYMFESTLEQLILESETIVTKGQKIYEEYKNKLQKVTQKEDKTENITESTTPELHAELSSSEQSATNLGENDTPTEQVVLGAPIDEKSNIGIDRTESDVSIETILSLLGEQTLNFDIAECRDAVIALDIDEDDLHAHLSISAPYGGSPATEESILAVLQAQNVTFGIDETMISSVLEKPSCDSVLVATGIKPKKGRASQFEALVSEQISTAPKIDDKGRVNYHDINVFVIVEPGDKLMRRTHPGKGKSGTDILGKIIPPMPGDILPFSGNSSGSTIAENDHNLILATEKGHPVITERGVSVSDILMLTNVGLSTGNINFDGSVCVKEDVADGVKIEATGDVTVKGVVGKAKIIAGGNIVILQGLIGGSKTIQENDEEPYGADLKAQGSVSAHFVTRSKIRATNSILVAEYVSHSNLYADKQILIGQKSGKGHLIGGKSRAFDLVSAKVIGCPGGSETTIQVGAEGDNIVQLRRISKEKRLNDENTYDVNEALHKISLLVDSAGMTPQMKEKIEKLTAKLEKYQQELLTLEAKEQTLKQLLVRSKKSRVISNHQIYNNTSVSILGSNKKITDETTGGTFKFEARKVVFEH